VWHLPRSFSLDDTQDIDKKSAILKAGYYFLLMGFSSSKHSLQSVFPSGMSLPQRLHLLRRTRLNPATS